MKIKLFTIISASLIALGKAKNFNFKVVSLYGDTYGMAVKYDNNVVQLQPTNFPLFTGSVNADNIKQYKYIITDGTGQQVEEEQITRTYSDENSKINEVFNRTTNKKVEIPDLPRPLKGMYTMGSEKVQPLPKDTIFNVYGKCDEAGYADLSNNPFINDITRNDQKVNCTFTIVSPDQVYSSAGSIHLLGFGSRTYKKLSWGVKFDKKFRGRKAFKLRAMAGDPTLIREKLATEVYKALSVPVQEGTYARVIINNDVYGLYSIVDSLSSKWISAYVHGDEKAKVGINYKMFSSHPQGPYADLKYKGDDYTQYEGSNYVIDEYEKTEYAEDDMAGKYKHLMNFIKLYDNWVKTYGNDQSDKAIDELKKFLNIESTLRALVVDSLTMALDNFFLYNGNVALYYNPQRNNYQFLPYDFDQSLVGTKGKEALDANNALEDCITWVNYTDNEVYNHYFTNNLLSHPQIRKRYDVILAKALQETFKKDLIHNYVHAVADLIREDVQWNFDLIDKLNIGYGTNSKMAFVNHFTLEEFEANLDYGEVDYVEEKNYDDAPYGIEQIVEIRGNYCRAYTANVDTSNNENISDNYDISEIKSSDALSSISTKTSLLFILSQLIIYFVFF